MASPGHGSFRKPPQLASLDLDLTVNREDYAHELRRFDIATFRVQTRHEKLSNIH